MEQSGTRARLESTPMLENRGPGGWEQPVVVRPYYMPPGCLIRHKRKGARFNYSRNKLKNSLNKAIQPTSNLVHDSGSADS